MRVGLTGGIGSGKSAVAALLEGLGAFVIDTDRLAREAVAPGTAGFGAVAAAWPHVVRDGILDRAALADVVFADPSARSRLDAIVHPIVRRLALERERDARPGQPIVHVVPLLFETGYDGLVDAVVLVVAPREVREARIAARDGLDGERIRARMAAQMDAEQTRVLADFVIVNDAGMDELRARTADIYERLDAR